MYQKSSGSSFDSLVALILERKGQVQDIFGLDNDWGMRGDGKVGNKDNLMA